MRVRIVALAVLCVFWVGSLATTPGGADEMPEADALRHRLETTMVTLEVEEAPLVRVLEALEPQAGVNLLIDARIESDVAEIPVSVSLEDAPVATALDLIVPFLGEEARWQIRANTVVFTTREFMPLGLKGRILSVGSLVAPRTAFVPRSDGFLDVDALGASEAAARPYGTVDELLAWIRAGIDPAFWEETEGADLRAVTEDRVLVVATPEMHRAVDRFLDAFDRRASRSILVEARLVPTETGTPARSGGASGPASATHGFTLTVRDGVPSLGLLGQRQAYRSLDTRVLDPWTWDASDVRVQQQEVGIGLCVEARAAPDGSSVLVRLGARHVAPGAMRTATRKVDDPVHLASRMDVRWRTPMRLEAGSWRLVEGRLGGEDAGGFALFVRAAVLDGDDGEAAPAAPRAVEVPWGRRRADASAVFGAEPVTVRWEETSLRELAARLRALTGRNVYLTPRLLATKGEDVAITLSLDDVPVSTLLDLVTEPWGIAWSLSEGGVLVLDDARRRPLEVEPRIFDVADLVAPVPRRSRVVAWEAARRGEQPDASPYVAWPPRQLEDLIPELIGGRHAWERPAWLGFRDGRLLVSNTPSLLQATGDFLEALRRARRGVEVTVEAWHVEDDVLEALATADGALPARLDARHLEALAGALEAGGARRLGRERLNVFEGSEALRETIRAEEYVADYADDAPSAGRDRRAVATLETGTRIALRAEPAFTGGDADVEIAYERRERLGFERVSTRFGPIDLPHVDVWRVHTGLRVPGGTTVLAGAAKHDGAWRLLLVRAAVRTMGGDDAPAPDAPADPGPPPGPPGPSRDGG